MIVIIQILMCLFIFCIGLLVGIKSCTKDIEKQVKKEMWRLCDVCKYKNSEEKTGHWKSYCYQNNICSVCDYIIADSDTDEYKYCPNCGTRMVESHENEDEEEK